MVKFRHILAVAMLVAATACGGGDRAAGDGTPALVDPARLDALLGGYVERGELVGVSALVFEGGEEAYFGAFGMADREQDMPMQRDTLVRIYSMTKPLTGVTLMTLHEDGLFGLDDPLAKYLPEYADVRVFAGMADGEPVLEAPSRAPTIRDAMRHTAGFTDGAGDGWLAERYREAEVLVLGNTLEEFSRRLAEVPLEYHPGTRWRYGVSVDVQARLVEVLAGKPFVEVLRARVLAPLGMTETRYRLRGEQLDRFSALYQRRDDGSFTRASAEHGDVFNTADWPLTPGGWGLVSTLDDYMRFARMLLNEGELDGVRILEPETVRLMATDAMPDTVSDRSWLPGKGQVGFGIDFAVRIAPPADSTEASGALGEFFWDGAANTLFWVDPKNDLAAVLFNHYTPFEQNAIHKDFRDAVYYRDETASALGKPPPAPESQPASD